MRSSARRALVVAGLLAALGHGALAQPAPRDDRGHPVDAAVPATRIVSLLPSLTESVCALGGCDRLVGTDRYSNWPARVAALPKLGGIDDAQVERIVALQPDLVLATASARVTDRLEALGLRVVVLEPRDRADVRRSLDVIATLLGTPAAAGRLWDTVERETAEALHRMEESGRRQSDAVKFLGGSFERLQKALGPRS